MKQILFSIALIFLVGFNTKAQDISAADYTKALEQGVVSFVNGVKKQIAPQSSFEDFKFKLIGEANMKTITQEGDALLLVTYNLINSNASDSKIAAQGFYVFGDAMNVVLTYENTYGLSGPSLGSGSVYLLGGDAESLSGFEMQKEDKCCERKKCKWYQLGCHIDNALIWICDHPETIKTLILIWGTIHR